AKVPFLNTKEKFKIGKAVVLTEGGDITIVASGHLVSKALDAAYELKNKNIQARVINLHTPKPIDRETVIKAARETGAVLTVEEHSVFGGVGSAVAEVLVEECPVPMKMMGIRDEFGRSGSPDELFEYFGLTTADIVKETEILIKRKK
ncbi:MAG: transketolase family protein, partial [Candidatus Omnitrophica bacterium]|nr:transketolase family protein [Candidatus Omnitrophota bacterium]